MTDGDAQQLPPQLDGSRTDVAQPTPNAHGRGDTERKRMTDVIEGYLWSTPGVGDVVKASVGVLRAIEAEHDARDELLREETRARYRAQAEFSVTAELLGVVMRAVDQAERRACDVAWAFGPRLVEALHDSGYKIVAREPTEAMHKAGNDEMDAMYPVDGQPGNGNEFCEWIWEAMWDAAE